MSLDDVQNTQNTVDRRKVIGAAAWAAPVIALAVATPAGATSQVQYQAHSGSGATIAYGSYQGSDNSQEYGLLVQVVNTYVIPWATFSANVPGLTATVTNFVATYDFPFAVDVQEMSSDWTLTESEPAGGPFTYTFTPNSLPSAPIEMREPLGDATPNVITPENSLIGPSMLGVGVNPPPHGTTVTVPYKHTYDFTVTFPNGTTVNDSYTFTGAHVTSPE